MYVVKVGGKVLEKNLLGVVESVSREASKTPMVLVHGGGNVVTEYCRRLGIEPKFVTSPEGIRSRYTDRDELEVYVMVMAGKLNKGIVASLISKGVKAVGITGADGPTLIAERKKRIVIIDERGRKRVIDGGYTGRVVSVNSNLLRTFLGSGYTVVVAPIAVDVDGNMLNVDADQVAFNISSTLKVDKLVILTDVPGVLINGEVLKRIKADEVEEMVSKGMVGAGMNRKLIEAANSVRSGVGEVVIASGLVEDPLGEVLKGSGTVVSK
ncbi:MAG: [LysW]-aminoadipate/[LysW]-glutamate kinase [Sulfolobales archaeon]